jgi:transcriptional regulator of heat shock response
MSKKNSEELLLEMVIEYFVKYWSPIWSKFLFESEEIEMAPSTIRKYLNILEKKWLVYQPYNSAGRIPTVDGINMYINSILPISSEKRNLVKISQNFNLRWFIEKIGDFVDWVAFGYFEDEADIYYLWVSKILKKVWNDIEKIIPLMEFIEKKEIITYLSKKKIEDWRINYSFVNYNWSNIALMYIKVLFESRPAIIWIVWSLRVNYKENISILEKILKKWQI